MITILIITNSLTLAALVYYIVSGNQGNQGNPGTVPLDCSTIDSGNSCGLNPLQATTLIEGYRDNHFNYINNGFRWGSGEGFDSTQCDSRSVWFRLEAIKRFLCEIETNALTRCGISDLSTLGVRIYFGEYPYIDGDANTTEDDDRWAPFLTDPLPAGIANYDELKQIYSGKHTLVMVPTYNSNGIDTDFDPRHANNAPGSICSMSTVCQSEVALMLNHGSMCPPPFPEGLANGAMANPTYYYTTCGAYFLD